ncbi:hypothetical protein Tco_1401572 [Tanacetum coccineum]
MSNSNTNLQTQSSNALHNAIMEAGSKDRPPMLAPVLVAEGSSKTTIERYMENYKNVSQDIRDQLNAEAEAVQIILTGIDNDIYSTVDACPNACEMWKAIERLKQGESINVQDLETNLYWEFGKFTSRDGESLESYYSRFYKMMNELQHQNEVNEIRAERLARTANPLALVAQQQPVYHPQNHPTQNTQYSSTRSQQSTRNRGKAIVTSSAPTYDPEPATINRGTGYDNQRAVNVVEDRENVGALCQHQETISLMSQAKEGSDWLYKTHEEKELDKSLLENKVKFYKTEFLKKDLKRNPRLYDIGCYNDNLALMLAPESNETICLDKESRSKLSDIIRPFDYDQLNNLYDLFVPQREKSPEQHYFPRTSKMSHTSSNNEFSKESFRKQTTLLEKRMDESNPWDQKCKSSKELFKIKKSVDTIFDVVERCKKTIAKRTYFVNARFCSECVAIFKNTNVIAPGMYKVHTKPNQTRTPRLPQDIRKTNKRVSFSIGVIPTTSVSRPQLKSNQLEDRVMPNNSQGKKQNVEDHRRNFKFSNNKTFVTACNDSLNAKTSNVNFVCVTCGKCVLNDNHDLCVLHYINGVNSRTRQPIAVPISTREPKHNVNQSVATSSKKTVATDSTVKKSRNITLKGGVKLYEQVSKTCSWWYPKYTPPGCNWKPKSQIGNVNPNIRTVKFGNDQIAPILGYGDLVHGT